MNKIIKIIKGAFITLAILMCFNPNKAYAYDLKDLEKSIENPDFFDNQEGLFSTSSGDYKSIDELVDRPSFNVAVIYLNKNQTQFQIRVRQYDVENNIDKNEKDYTWEAYDTRVCTVDSNGLVKQGEMTGGTVLLGFDGYNYIMITVINTTGNCESWYEKMFDGILGTTYLSNLKTFKYEWYPKRLWEIWGECFKLYVDSYINDKNKLNNDSDYRIKLAEKICEVGAKTIGLGDDYVSKCTYMDHILKTLYLPFIGVNKNCLLGSLDGPRHVTCVLMLDGVTYSVDNGHWGTTEDRFTSEKWTFNEDKTILSGEIKFRSGKFTGNLYSKRKDYSILDKIRLEEQLLNGYNP